MPDKYNSFAELAKNCAKDAFNIRSRDRGTDWAIMAPHGGGIEPGTSEIAEQIAQDDFSFYAFEGKLPHGNKDLHVTSACFDEPSALDLAAKTGHLLTIHGENSADQVIFIGGTDKEMIAAMTAKLEQGGFTVQKHDHPLMQGLSPDNICNKGRTGKGVQLELSLGLRKSFFEALVPRQSRSATTPAFDKFVTCLRQALHR